MIMSTVAIRAILKKEMMQRELSVCSETIIPKNSHGEVMNSKNSMGEVNQ